MSRSLRAAGVTTPAAALPPSPAAQGMRSTLVGIGVNAVLAIVKIAVGLAGHAYALVADGFESVTDVVTSLLVWFGLRIAARPADENHPQGHGKAESLAALSVALALIIAAIGIAIESVHGIRTPHRLPAPFTLAVLIGVIVVKEMLFRFVSRVGKEVESTAVKSEAVHQRSDVTVSAAAFVGITVALVGAHLHPGPRWETADDWAALMASFVIAWNGIAIGRQAVYDLTDASPDPQVEEDVRRVAAGVAGVTSLDKCLVRKSGFDYYVELDVRVDRDMPVYQAHDIAHRVQDAVREQAAHGRIARVLVHIEPSSLPA